MISTYTVITGDKDHDVERDYPVTIFRDSYDKFKDDRRNSRMQKILVHKYFDSEYTIYHDANMKLLISPEEVVSRYMTGYDMALFRHGTRNCVYDEAMTVAKLGLDDVETIIEQAKYYEDREYGKGKGLYQGGFIVRRNNARTRRFNEAWFADYCRFSRRDQLSLPVAIDTSGVIVNVIPGHWVEKDGKAWIGDIVEMYQHKNLSGNFNEQK